MSKDINSYRLTFNVVAGFIGAVGAYFFGGWTQTLTVLFTFCVIDYLSGLVVAACGKSEKTENGGLNSSVGFIGIVKKIFIFILIAVAHLVEVILPVDTVVVSQGAAVAFACNEAISILENAGLLGVDLGPVAQLLEVLKSKTNK
jgi:toxin secretion/phage lysis holin